MSLKAGAWRVDISPRRSTFLTGYPHVERMSTGIHDPLFATALYLENGEDRLVSVALDLLYISHAQARALRCQIAEELSTGIEHVLISATHTHSGPNVSDMVIFQGDPVVPRPDPEYLVQLSEGILEAARQAAQNAEPARLAVSSAQAHEVGGNRIDPAGLHDREIGLLYVQREEDGSPLALQMVYSMHPTVLHEDSTFVSSDFPAFTRQTIEQAFPGITVLYHNGTSGNLSPRYHVRGQTFEEAKRLGQKLAQPVIKALHGIAPASFTDSPRLAAARRMVQLPTRNFPPLEEAEAARRAAVAEFERLKREGAGHGPVRTAECTVFGAEEVVTLARAQQNGQLAAYHESYRDIEVNLLRVDGAYLAGWPGEFFVEYGLETKKRAGKVIGGGKTFVITMASGDTQGYIVTPEATGYEARMSFFEPAAGQIVMDATLELIEQLNRV